ADLIGQLGLAGAGIAAVNGPHSVVVSGDLAGLTALEDACEREGIRARRVPVDYASHSPLVEPIQQDLAAGLAGIRGTASEVPWISTVTGGLVAGEEIDAQYWFENLRRPVMFETAVRTAATAGHSQFIECSPHPVLVPGIEEILDQTAGVSGTLVTGSLRRDDGGIERMRMSAAELFVTGGDLDWAAVQPPGRPADLPTYPFQRQRFWLEPAPVPQAPHHEQIGRLSYRVTWEPLPLPQAGPRQAAPAGGRWLVVAASPEQLAVVTGPLRNIGMDCLGWVVDTAAADRAELVGRLRTLAEAGGIAGVVALLAWDERLHPRYPAVTSGLTATTALLQALADAEVSWPVWLVTAGAVRTSSQDAAPAPVQAQAWGLGLAAALEFPQLWGGMLDLPAGAAAGVPGWAWPGFVKALADRTGEDQVAVRESGALARRLERAGPAGASARDGWQPTGTVLVTGGTSGPGARVARWLAGAGVGHLLLTGPGGPEPADFGVPMTIADPDLADRDQVAALLRLVPPEHPLTAVVHAASAEVEVPLLDITPAHLAEGLAARAAGATHLHELVGDVAAFVLFSSVAGVWGGAGQAAYGAAAAHVDALAQARQAAGQPAAALAWGLLADAEIDAGQRDQLLRRGLRPIPAELAVSTVQRAAGAHNAGLVVADVDWAQFIPLYTSTRPAPFLTGLIPAGEEPGEHSGGEQPALASRLAGLAADEQRDLLAGLVQAETAAVLGHAAASDVDIAKPFREQGFDSLAAVSLRNRLTAATGLKLPATLVFDYPTPERVADLLRAALEPETATAAGEEPSGEVAALIEAASDEELFHFIDTHLAMFPDPLTSR
ncbi:MAG: KR domain-containing protein, partial [Streptosporangiaceae bacterium]|nr:KR domain-containing protein [Streptosporangiaceae bacterium]